jgi:hypothetical protein
MICSAAMLMIAAMAGAQQPAAPASTAAQSTATAAQSTAAQTSDANAANAALQRKARDAGYKTEVHNGATQFCTEAPEIGSHFTKKTCLTQDQLKLALERREAAKEQFTNHTCTGCSGK